MSHVFNLQPDFLLLKKYGYIDGSNEVLQQALINKHTWPVEIESVWTQDKRIEIASQFEELIKEFHLHDIHHTLLYICLVESNDADANYQNAFDTYKKHKAQRELAQILLLFKKENPHQPDRIKISSLQNAINITDADLINWIGNTLKSAIESKDYPPTGLGGILLSFIADKNGKINEKDQPLNYDTVLAASQLAIRKPGIRERNRHLAKFLSNVLLFLNNETILRGSERIKVTDRQLSFLFRVATILEWIDENDFDSEPKDYLSTLLSNYRQYN